MTTRTLKRNIFQRILGIPATKPPADPGCWEFGDGSLKIDLSRAPELSEPFGALHLESEAMPTRVMVMQDGSGGYRAFENKCAHAGRKLDPVPGTETIQCCSMGHRTYDYQGNVLSGEDEIKVRPLNVQAEDGTLIIEL